MADAEQCRSHTFTLIHDTYGTVWMACLECPSVEVLTN